MSDLKIGVMLPTFSADPALAMRAAAAGEAGGLDGLFAFDHLWPMGSPGRPAMWSFGVLGAVAARTTRVCVGPLVARVGLLPEEDLLGAFGALAAVAGTSRVIAAVGAGDRLSAGENLAYGVAYGDAGDRVAALQRTAAALVALGLTTWVGGKSAGASDAARTARAARNLWAATADEIAAAAATTPVTWAGQVLVGRDTKELAMLRDRYGDRPGLVVGTVGEVAAHLGELHAAGAGWCVCTPLDYIARATEAVETMCLVRQAVP